MGYDPFQLRHPRPRDAARRLREAPRGDQRALKKTGAKLIWASSTPLPQESKYGDPAAVVERNEIAARLAAKHGMAIDDLFAFITPHLAEAQNANDVHFNEQGYQLLGGQVATSIEPLLKRK